MFDILMFLFENYPQVEYAPDRDTLAIKLNAAGFELGEIEQVLDWLGELDAMDSGLQLRQSGLRSYADVEEARLDAESRGFLLFLEQSGLIDAAQREWIIDRVMAMDEDDITEQIRWVALVLLWSQHPGQNFLLLEDMVFNHGASPTLH